ncbi:MAG TPA: hypothetical protein PKZ75_15475, partial [Bacteroidia bacterium]|nr:hypothetical protein [Bacteroidia bacterium]
CFFLFKLLQKLQDDYTNLFGGKRKSNKRDDERSGVSDFFERWGFEYWFSEVVKDSLVNEDEVWKWNVIRYYNKLSYLKDKAKYENVGK